MMWWIAAIVCAADQLTKLWAVHVLRGGKKIVLLDGFFQLTYATNQGGAAGILHGYPQVLTVLSITALVIILWWAGKVPAEQRLARVGFGAVLGGALGNMLDRLFRGGLFFNTYVVDFLDVHWRDLHWPTFNLADSAICVGIAIVIFSQLRTPDQIVACEPNGRDRGPRSAPSQDTTN